MIVFLIEYLGCGLGGFSCGLYLFVSGLVCFLGWREIEGDCFFYVFDVDVGCGGYGVD